VRPASEFYCHSVDQFGSLPHPEYADDSHQASTAITPRKRGCAARGAGVDDVPIKILRRFFHLLALVVPEVGWGRAGR